VQLSDTGLRRQHYEAFLATAEKYGTPDNIAMIKGDLEARVRNRGTCAECSHCARGRSGYCTAGCLVSLLWASKENITQVCERCA
jgi:hypothetical protein